MVAAGAALAYLAALGIVTAIIANPLFRRMTPPTPFSYIFWILTSILTGLVAATYVPGPDRANCSVGGKTSGGGILSVLAVGCPICNKVVVLVLGVSGALTYFSPIQPVIGLASLGLLAWALWTRTRGQSSTPPAAMGRRHPSPTAGVAVITVALYLALAAIAAIIVAIVVADAQPRKPTMPRMSSTVGASSTDA